MQPARPRVVFMFSGQGSHYPGMGKALYEQNPVFRGWMRKLDDLARDELGVSVISRLYGDARHPGSFNETALTHPAILMVEYALAQTLISSGVEPELHLGASLGEVTAAALAGVLEIEDCVRFVVRQARVFDGLCPPGGMMAVLHSPDVLAEYGQPDGGCEVAGINGPQNFVVSGPDTALGEFESFLRARGIATSRLPVSHAFHSRLINPAREAFLALSRELRLKRPVAPLVSCTRADFVEDISHEHFWDVVRRPFNTRDTIRKLLSSGAYVYLDAGPSGTMSNLIKYNCERPPVPKSLCVIQPFGDELARLRSAAEEVGATRPEPKENQLKKTAYLFPGQGSQFKGMGESLFAQFPHITSKADALLGYSIEELCVRDPRGKLSHTEYTQPAMYVVSVLSYLRQLSEGAPLPDFFAGHSLGEYAALFAAGVFDFETGLRLVRKRGALMSAASGGGMAAILQLDRATVGAVIRESGLSSIDVANFNAPKQTVIAGPMEALNEAQGHFEKAGGMFIPLMVSAPFHSRYMEPAQREFAAFLDEFEFSGPKVPVISNVTAKPYGDSPSEIKSYLTRQITSPVRWVETVGYLMRCGVRDEFKEIGPGDVLTKLVAAITRDGVPDDTPAEDAPPPAAPAAAQVVAGSRVRARITAESLGSASFRRDYGVKYAYVAGAMYMGIASKELVIRMGKAGLLGFFGTGGLGLPEVEANIQHIQRELSGGEPFGMNLLFEPANPEFEVQTVRLFHKYGVKCVEASAFMQITPALVLFRLKGLSQTPSGEIQSRHKIIAKVSRPEVTKAFLEPSPPQIVERLLLDGQITPREAELGRKVPVATDVCAEADSGGHTDRAVTSALLPTTVRLRDRLCAQFGYREKVRVGSAGGIGTPEAAAAAFLLGADFILTGSVNQCTREAGTSDLVKDMLQKVNVQDTDYAPAGDMFEIGAKVQVMKRGVFFAARANKLYELWKNHESIDEIDEKDRVLIQEKYFKRNFDEVYADVCRYYAGKAPEELAKAERNGKHKMALIFKTYLNNGTRAALEGDESNRVNFQVQCGPALGAFNQWVSGTELEDWRNRHVDGIAERIMVGAATLLNERFDEFTSANGNHARAHVA